VRGDLLTYWEPAGVSAGERQRWLRAARRIAAGIAELVHLRATLDPTLLVLAFSRGKDIGQAARWVSAILSENVEARVVVDGAGIAGVSLPCRPDTSDEEIRHVVLSCVKAAHPAIPETHRLSVT